MAVTEPRVDAYIEKSADFAQPILARIRSIIHKHCPEVEEKIKWSSPHFDYRGAPLCHMAAFKQHCGFGFWKASLIHGLKDMVIPEEEQAMGSLGKITSVQDLPDEKILAGYIHEAMLLNEKGITLKAAKVSDKKELVVPKELEEALKANMPARETFERFSYSHKKEYAEWIAGAKTEATRQRRLETALEWLAEGKSRDWKYKK
jgi:uncharacterized protein YdeI (YjbR/CyaY-like superfamily)